MNRIERFFRRVRLFGPRTTLQIALSAWRKAHSIAHYADLELKGTALWRATWRQWRQMRRLRQFTPVVASAKPETALTFLISDQLVSISCNNCVIYVTVLAPDLLRVQLQRPDETPDVLSYAVAKTDDQWSAVPFKVEDRGTAFEISTERLTCRIEKAFCEIAFRDPQREGVIINGSGDAGGMGWNGAGIVCSRRLAPNERIYGLGEQAFGLDRRGQTYTMWNDDPNGAYSPGAEHLYLNIPFYMGVRPDMAYGIFFDNTFRARIDAGAAKKDDLSFQAQGGSLRYYFFYGPQATTVIERYTELTGRLRLPPLWALGYHQSRWSYSPDSRVRELAKQFRQRRIPCEAIHLDIDYMDRYRCFTWSPQRFPDPVGLIKELHDQGFKVVPLIDCGIKVDKSYAVCSDGLAAQAFCTFPDGELFHGPVWPGDCFFPDFTSPAACAWWGKQYRPLLEQGVDGIWNDMNEPTVFATKPDTMPDCVHHDWEGQGATHAQAHNVYGLQMARATAEGLQELRPDQRTFVLTRSAWAGLQRYAMNWMGDNTSSWGSLRQTPAMVANLGLSGLAFTGPDTGGFDGACNGELLARWMQLGVFTPFFRNHTALDTIAQEPWAFGEPYESINRASIELRYQLLPYIYTAFWQCSQTGLPMLRPLFLQWQGDSYSVPVDDEFMFGDALLIAPIAEAGATKREIYLPPGAWYDWWSGLRFAGLQKGGFDAPLDKPLIFARAGSVVPAWPVMQYTGERPLVVLTLHVFPGEGESTLYEDDGQTMAYQQGNFRLTRFSVHLGPGSLTVERHCEGPFTPTYEDIELVIHSVDQSAGCAVTADGRAMGWGEYDQVARTLRWRGPLAETYVVH